MRAATSLWLPLSYENLFDFLKYEKNRAQSDVLPNGNASNEIAHISTGTHPGNRIFIIQPYVTQENSLLILQESCIDSLGAMVIYASIELPSIVAAVSGQDTTGIPVLPSGFVVSADGRADKGESELHPHRWDVLSDGNASSEIAHISTGTRPGNFVSIIQPCVPKESSMLILQESCIDSLGAMVIYAPTELPSIISALYGQEMSTIPILPSGFEISTDGGTDEGVGASSSSGKSKSRGSLLTVAFMCYGTVLPKELIMQSVADVHALISSTVQKIKTLLDYS